MTGSDLVFGPGLADASDRREREVASRLWWQD